MLDLLVQINHIVQGPIQDLLVHASAGLPKLPDLPDLPQNVTFGDIFGGDLKLPGSVA